VRHRREILGLRPQDDSKAAILLSVDTPVSVPDTVFLSEAQRRPFPWVGVSGRAFFRVGLERALSTRWQREIAGLVHAVRTVP
jgi:hypothetical protein